MSNLKRDFIIFCKENNLNKETKVLVSLSGGPDSVALLLLANEYFKNVVVVHVNHNLRGEESDKEEEFCKNICEKLGVKCFVGKLDKEKIEKLNQETYRELRYDFIKEVFVDTKSEYLLTGHHKNDLTETVLINVLKGSGLEGMVGIKPISRLKEMKIVRPLIQKEKSEIVTFLEKRGQGYKTDSSNLKDDYTRNKIRNKVIPLLEEELKVNVTKSLSQLSESMMEMQNYFYKKYQEIKKDVIEVMDDEVIVNWGRLEKEDKVIVKQVLYYIFKEYLKMEIKNTHILEIFKLNKANDEHVSIKLANGWVCTKLKNKNIYKKL